MELLENAPLDTRKIADLITSQEDMFLVFPQAIWPFDHQQWKEILDPKKGNRSFFLWDQGVMIGHAALLNKSVPQTYTVGLLYIKPDLRSQGLGRWMVGELEKYALSNLEVQRLVLRVRDYNPRAITCYLHCGYKEIHREGTAITMEKHLLSSIQSDESVLPPNP